MGEITDDRNHLDRLFDHLGNDFPSFLRIHKDVTLRGPGRSQEIRLVTLEDPEKGVFHAAIAMVQVNRAVLSKIDEIWGQLSELRSGVEVESGHVSQEESYETSEASFSGTFFVYTDDVLVDEEDVEEVFDAHGWRVRVRDKAYRDTRWDRRSWDVFLCHDSRDEDFVTELSKYLLFRDVKAWVDKGVLELGDSLSGLINEGISEADYGLVVLSENFIDNVGWASSEWEALESWAMSQEGKVLLPIWYQVSESEIRNFSPWLADKVAVKAESPDDAPRIADEVKRVVRSN